MSYLHQLIRVATSLGVLSCGAVVLFAEPATRPVETSSTAPASQPIYTYKPRSPDGIGKVYHGREIAQVMGHLGAGWLERPGREREEKPRQAVARMKLE